jgi:predicted aspartyl protease
MVEGKFSKGSPIVPMVPALISSLTGGIQTPFFLLDTGFSGDIAVTEEMGRELGLKFDTVLPLEVATGEIKNFPVASAFATMEGITLYVTAILVKGRPLVGITFLQKFNYKAIIDCKYKTVELSRVL